MKIVGASTEQRQSEVVVLLQRDTNLLQQSRSNGCIHLVSRLKQLPMYVTQLL